MFSSLPRFRFRVCLLILASFVVTFGLSVDSSPAAKPRPRKKPKPARLQLAPPPPASALLKPEDWQKAATTPIEPGEIDRLLASEMHQGKVTPAPLTSDEQFLRRATLDLTGQLPTVSEIQNFLADTRTDKRAQLINRLLDSDAYARHWAHYWFQVVTARLPDRRGQVLGRAFESWMFDQLKANHSWADIARAIITATGELRFDEPDKNGQAFFLAMHRGKDAADEMAAETSRIFLGIQIQCAQCHDHKTDQWKRVQFHELAGYFARLRQRPVRNMDKKKQVVGLELVSLRFGEHRMTDKQNPKKLLLTLPHFLDGDTPGRNAADLQRRQALARDITRDSNFWFSAAFVNRTVGVLMGQAFYEPVDDMGPKKEALYPSLLARLAGSFRGNHYNIKQLFSDLMNTEAYQRQVRLNEPTEQLQFAAAYPTRLPADALWKSLTRAIGDFPIPPMLARRLAKLKKPFLGGFANFFQQEFAFDPSLKADEVEGSITQALMLMNNPQINFRLQARGRTTLAKLLRDYPEDDQAIDQLYLRTLARRPTDHEMQKCRAYIDKVGKRPEAFEDIFWVLVNSTEFQTKR